MSSKFILLFIVLFNFGCAALFENRTFIDEMDHDTDGVFVPGQDFQVVPGDNGQAYRSRADIVKRTPASVNFKREQAESRSLEQELVQKESTLYGRELIEYEEHKGKLGGISERIFFLSLSRPERSEYLSQFYDAKPSKSNMLTLITESSKPQGDIYIGMSKDGVLDTWGRPSSVEVAGNPRNENERWVFRTRAGLNFIYFDNGRVSGWSME